MKSVRMTRYIPIQSFILCTFFHEKPIRNIAEKKHVLIIFLGEDYLLSQLLIIVLQVFNINNECFITMPDWEK